MSVPRAPVMKWTMRDENDDMYITQYLFLILFLGRGRTPLMLPRVRHSITSEQISYKTQPQQNEDKQTLKDTFTQTADTCFIAMGPYSPNITL